MDLGFIDMCLKSYNGKLSEDDERRMQFFRGLWETMANAADARAEGHGHARTVALAEERTETSYEVPPLEELRELYAAGTPVFDVAPVAVDTAQFAEIAQTIASYLANSGNYDASLGDALSSVDWTSAFDVANASAETPSQLPERLGAHLAESLDDAQAAQLAALVSSLALYTFYEEPAKAIMKAIGYDEVINAHPLLCPVCGGEPLLASVGTKTSSAGRGRLLYCATCGAPWEFDRVRCAHCGTHDQTKLHYTSIEGDEDHRLAHCDECNGFLRTTFMDSSLFPLSPLVEDVVMAPLAALATERAR